MAIHESFWSYRRFRYLRAALAVVGAALAFYFLHRPQGGHSGGTVYGYTLGAISAALMLWLTWFGARKRSYYASGPPLRGWLSAHVYLGLTLMVLVPLHAGFQFGPNVHTLAFVLLSIVIVSGVVGAAVYGTVPRQMTENRPGEKLEALLERIAELDTECRSMAAQLPDELAQAVLLSVDETRLGGSLLQQLSGHDPHCGTQRALKIAAHGVGDLEGSTRVDADRLVEVLSLKRTLVDRVRRDVRLKALLDLWLLFHVPFALASLVAVAAHIVAVFYYY